MMTKPASHHILIVDDDDVLQTFLSDFLSQEGYQTTLATQGEEISELLNNNPVDLVILDVMLPGKDGFYWLDWLQEHHPAVKILMLSVKTQDDDRIHCLETGAYDYICKPFNPRELLARVNNILRMTQINNTAVTFGDFCFHPDSQRLTKNDQDIKLTTTESKILSHLCQNTGKTLTRDDLAQALRGDSHHPLDRSIDVHINRLRRKIEDDASSPLYIRTVWGKGYQFHTNT